MVFLQTPNAAATLSYRDGCVLVGGDLKFLSVGGDLKFLSVRGMPFGRVGRALNGYSLLSLTLHVTRESINNVSVPES